MIRLPAALERRLTELFPKVREREKFVAEIVSQALDGQIDVQEEMPEAVGGTVHLFTDGGSRGNPGQAAIGIVVEDPSKGEVLREHCERIGVETNNVAEYRALIEGLRIAVKYHPNRLVCHLDSELIVKQLKGEYKVKMASFREFIDEISDIITDIPNVEFIHIPRADNHHADALVNKALDEHSTPRYEKPGF